MLQRSKFNRLIVAGITAAAIAPATAVAQPAIDGGVQAPQPGVTQDLRAPDQVDGGAVGRPVPGLPQWPANPQPIANRPVASTDTVSDDGGIDGGVLIAAGGGLLVVGGLGLARRKRTQVARQRQLA